MDETRPIDPGRAIDWGKTSSDYSKHRPGPPDSFYDRLRALGVGLPQQRILDLGTGTGLLARKFAEQGSLVSGIDISDGQIEAARELAREQRLSIDFRVSPAETTPFPSHSFDAITANQCWLYFDKPKVIREVKRLLKPGGVLVTSHFSWLSRLDAIARRSEQLVLKFNPQWTAADWSGEIPVVPSWSIGEFDVTGMFYYDEPIPFTHESWRGRIRACRGTGAALKPEELAKFDVEHEALLKATVPETFTVLHRLDAHFFSPK
ncbi:MAG: class I SAM-dependent methyltransferase [Bdellovibrionota bacterium]